MIKNILLCFLGIILGLILSEFILTFLDIPKFYKGDFRYEFYYHLNKDSSDILFYSNYPSSNLKFVYDGNPRKYFDSNNAVFHKTNSLGFRGAEFIEKKDTNTFRIAFIGDSFTYGQGVKDEDTYAEKLKEKLKKKYSNLNFESYNFGVGGYNTKDELFLLKNLALYYKPNAVILQYHLNDAEPQHIYYDKAKRSLLQYSRPLNTVDNLNDQKMKPPEELIYKFRISRLIWQIFNKKQLSANTLKYYSGMYTESNPNWITTRNSLKEFIRICGENKIDCYVVLFPLMFRLNDNYPFFGIHSKIKDIVLSDSSGYVTYVDLFPAFKGQKDADLWVHPTDQHPNEIAHEIAAQYLVQYMTVGK